MIARQPVRVLDDAFFTDIHEDLLPAHGTHAVRQVLGRHARLAVELGEKSTRKRQQRYENQPKWEATTDALGLLERRQSGRGRTEVENIRHTDCIPAGQMGRKGRTRDGLGSQINKT